MPPYKYKLRRHHRLSSSLSLSVSAEGEVVVRAPFWAPVFLIDSFVSGKTDWIEKRLKQCSSRSVHKTYTEGEKHLFFGVEYPLRLVCCDKPLYPQVRLTGDFLEVTFFGGSDPRNHSQIIKNALLRWYLEEGVAVITEKVNRFTDMMGVTYSKINLKKVTSIWGSCSGGNNLCFNRKLIMAPHVIVDYVVIHEVAHLTHRNHSQKFWELVAKFDPDYKNHRRWLKNNHYLLSL